MKKNLSGIFTISVVIVLLSVFSFAQDTRTNVGNLYVISANAGGVNYVEGKVSVMQNNGTSGYLLKGDKLEVGEKVSTGADGKAEILLNPGSYIRLAENSAFEFKTTSLDDLHIKLNRGSAMFEVITDNDFTFAVNTPKGHFYITESGVYRVDVLSDGSGKIEVWKGKAQVGDKNAQIIKSGHTATVNGNQVAIEKFDRDDKDTLEAWSKTRAKELAKINSRLDRNGMRNTLISSYRNNGWNIYNSYGLWVFDRFSSSYCFLPFGYGWNSPYGYGFGSDIWYLRMPRYIYYQPPVNPVVIVNQSPSLRGTLQSGDNAPGRIRSGVESRSEREVPPFMKIQPGVGRDRIDNGQFPSDTRTPSSVFNDSSPRFPSSAPMSVPASSMPTNSSAPSTGKDN